MRLHVCLLAGTSHHGTYRIGLLCSAGNAWASNAAFANFSAAPFLGVDWLADFAPPV